MAKKMELEKAYDEASKANTIQECQTIYMYIHTVC